jgi:hypothetical protein
LRAGKLHIQGRGTVTVSTISRKEEHERCEHPKTSVVGFKIAANEEYRETISIGNAPIHISP